MDYPYIKEVYRQQAELEKEHYGGYLTTGIGALLVVLVWAAMRYSTHEPWALLDLIVFGVLGLVIVLAIGLTWMVIRRGLQDFDALWERRLQEELRSDEGIEQFERLEKDLQLGSIRFKHFVLSKEHIVFFDEMGKIFPLSAIELVDIEEWHIASGSYLRAAGGSPRYGVGCYFADHGYVLLSSDPDELRDIVFELRSRKKDLLFSKPAFEYFFALEQQLIDEKNLL
jgi:hypothetical protein